MRILTLFLAWAFAACSLQPDLPIDGRPCTDAGDCLKGYGCIGTSCVENYTLGSGESCVSSQQCRGDAVCALAGIAPETACRPRCSQGFSSAGCSPGAYCAPVWSAEMTRSGACLPGVCDPITAGQSPAARRCSPVAAQISLALEPCTAGCSAAWELNGIRQPPHCEAQCNGGNACQPVGSLGSLGCVPGPVGTAGGEAGAACDHIDARCAPGFACIRATASAAGTCRAYCPIPDVPAGLQGAVTDACEAPLLCTVLAGLPKLGVCAP